MLPELHWIASDDLLPDDGRVAWDGPQPRPETLAYLQYTSGSTASPRGVMISHANVVANLAHLRKAFVYDERSVAVTWMPHYHDYGLVEGLLQPLYSGISSYVLSPLVILKRPLRWLQAISHFGATHSHAPNFAYELCLNQNGIEEAGLELGRWRMAGNGAEPIRNETLLGFARTFTPYGFATQAFFPAYGLAEATLFAAARRSTQDWKSCTLDAAALERDGTVLTPSGESRPALAGRRELRDTPGRRTATDRGS